MRPSTWTASVWLAVGFLVVTPTAASTLDSMTAIASSVPTCGLQCMTSEALISTCFMNITCVCASDELISEIQACVLANCTVPDALQTEKYAYGLCGIESEDRTALVWQLGIAFMALGVVAFGLRCLERLLKKTWGWDDLFIAVVTAILVPMGVLTIPLSYYGLGHDMWNVSPDSINMVLFYFYIEEVLYAVALGLNKIAILIFYLRVFPQRVFRCCAYVLIGLNLGYSTAYAAAVVLQCRPLDGAWRSWDGEYAASCVNINQLGWSGAAVNIALDIGTLVLPLPVLAHLTMSLRKKMQIVSMFLVGFFVTLVSILRLRSMIQFGSTTNITQDYVEVGYWSTIEIATGVLCACMPAIRALFSRLFPLAFGTRSGNSNAYPYETAKSGDSRHAALFSSKRSSQQQQQQQKHRGLSGTSAEIMVKNEWAVVVGTAATRSDVELVALEKQVPHFLSEEQYYYHHPHEGHSSPYHHHRHGRQDYARGAPSSDDRWSEESGKTCSIGGGAAVSSGVVVVEERR